MNDEQKKALADVQTAITEQIGAVVDKTVVAKLEEMHKAEIKPDKAAIAADGLKYFKAKYNKDIHGIESEDLNLATKDLDTTTDGSGDELVPDGFGNEVIRIAQKVGVARNNSSVIQLPTKIFTLPTIGDATAYRTGEKAKFTASSPLTGGITFTAQKLSGLVIATKECIEDANIDVMNWIGTLLGEAVAKKEDQWAYLGLDTGEGIFQNASVPVYTLGSGKDAFTDVTIDDMLLGLNEVDDNATDNLKWVMSFSILNHLRSLKNETTGLYYLQSPAATMPTQIWDVPFVLSTVMPKTTAVSQADAPFMAAYDPRYLMIGDRRSLSLEFAKEATVTSSDGTTAINLWEQDMVAIKVTERIDIQLAQADKAFVRFETAAS